MQWHAGLDGDQTSGRVGSDQARESIGAHVDAVGEPDGGEGVTGANRLDRQSVSFGVFDELDQFPDVARTADPSRMGHLVSGPVVPGVASPHVVLARVDFPGMAQHPDAAVVRGQPQWAK
ncbi:hypothetical protein BH24ACT9_BH24ACT9_13760 [soil metagenome]